MTTTTEKAAAPAQEGRPILFGEASARGLEAVSSKLHRFVDIVGKACSFLIIPLVLITVFDLVSRKIPGAQFWLVSHLGEVFQSTLLQELEWHVHTALFAMVLGYGYVHNTHVRVDLVREHLDSRKKAWLEFLGCTVFMLPYCTLVIYFAAGFAYDSWAIGEVSSSMVGLTHRWIIKTVLVIGLVLAFLAGFAVWLQTVLVLYAPYDFRFKLLTLEWPEEEGSSHEGVERLSLEDMEDDASKVAANFDFASEEIVKRTKDKES